MSNVVCKKCGAEAFSKCPATRNIFSEDRTLGMMEAAVPSVLEIQHEEGYTDRGTLVIRTRVWDEELEQAAALVENVLHEVRTSGKLKQFCCDHVWVMKPGQVCDFGCCHGEATEA